MIAALCMALTASAVGMLVFHALNKGKERQCAVQGIKPEQSAQFRDMGDDSPLYRFSL